MVDKELLYAQKLSKMIQCETISEKDKANNFKFEAFHKVLESLFPLVFSKCEIVKIDDSLLIRLPGKTKNSPFLFMSHQDVVPASGDWKHSPFSGDIEDGIIWGRGTVDTKGSLMCIFQAMEELLEENYIPNVDMYIASSSNEETSGDGAPKTVQYLKDHNVELQLVMDEGGMIVDDPIGGVKGRYAMIGAMEKGSVNYKVTAHSKGGHASKPSNNSPIARLSKFVVDIEKHNPNKSKMSETVAEMLKRLGKKAKGPLGFVLRHTKAFKPLLEKVLPLVDPTSKAMVQTTMAFTMIEGSDAANVLPEKASLIINVRLIHHQGLKETTEILRKYCSKYDLELEVLESREPQKPVDYNSKAFKLVEETVNEIYENVIPSPYLMTGNTDAYHYALVTDNAIRFAPLVINNQQLHSVHAIDENINASSLVGGVSFYKSLAKKIN